MKGSRRAVIGFGCTTLLLASMLSQIALFASGEPGGRKVATVTNYQWKDLWRGPGPAGSPTGSPPGLTIVHSKAAWTRLITAYGPPYDANANLSVDWEKDVVLFVQASEDDPATEVHLTSISGNGERVTVTAVLRAGPAGQPSLGVEARPLLIASAPAAAFADKKPVRFIVDGHELPVQHER
jgi:hypothetical protein